MSADFAERLARRIDRHHIEGDTDLYMDIKDAERVLALVRACEELGDCTHAVSHCPDVAGVRRALAALNDKDSA